MRACQLANLPTCPRAKAIAVVGASLAGLYAAAALAQAGRRVCVFEAQPELRFAPRTLIVTAELPRLLGFDPTPAILNRIRVFELFSPGGSARIALREPDLVVERGRLHALLAEHAAACGAELRPASALKEVFWNNHTPVLAFDTPGGTCELAANTLLGTDGVESVVADRLGKNHHPRVAILQVRVPRPADCPPDTVRIWFDRASTRFFYWLIPEGKAYAAFGLVADTPAQARAALEAALRVHGLEPLEYQEALVPLYPRSGRPLARVGNTEVYLAGDAAGQVKATTVGGVVAGLRGAAAAVNSILRRDARAAFRALERELFFHRLLRAILDRFTDADYDALLARLNRRGLELLASHNRDHLAHILLKLAAVQAPWAGLVFRAFARSVALRSRASEERRAQGLT